MYVVLTTNRMSGLVVEVQGRRPVRVHFARGTTWARNLTDFGVDSTFVELYVNGIRVDKTAIIPDAVFETLPYATLRARITGPFINPVQMCRQCTELHPAGTAECCGTSLEGEPIVPRKQMSERLAAESEMRRKARIAAIEDPVKRCPVCTLDNDFRAKTCEVCGEDLSRTVVTERRKRRK